jgi:hypothetical protein
LCICFVSTCLPTFFTPQNPLWTKGRKKLFSLWHRNQTMESYSARKAQTETPKKNPSRLHLHHQYVVPRLQNLPDFSEIQQKQTGPAQSEISKSGKIQSEFGSNSVKISRFGRLRIFSQGRIFEPSVVSLTVASLQKMKTQTPACRLVIKQRQQQPRHFHPTANDTSHLPSTHAPPSVSAVDQVRYPLVIPCNICCLIAADRGYRGGG